MAVGRQTAPGASLIAFAAILGTGLSIYNYVTPDNGINGTPGVLLVIASTLILFGFGLFLRSGTGSAGFRGFIVVSTLLNILGTALAAWLLESYTLLALMVICLAGWFLHLFTPHTA